MKGLEKEFVGLIDSAVQAKDFMVSELPEVVQQLLTFKVYEYSIELAMCVFFILLNIAVVVYSIRKFKKWNDAGKEGMVAISVGCSFIFTILGVVGVISGMESIKTLVQLHIAPKVFLIEYTAELLK